MRLCLFNEWSCVENVVLSKKITSMCSLIHHLCYSVYHSFNEYLCCCVSPCAVCEERSRTERSRREGNRDNCYSQRGRNGLRGTIYEATFSTTFRRHTQEFNSTGLFEMGSIDTTKPTINKSELPL